MQCPKCNEYIPEENDFCGKCGKNIMVAPGRIWLLVTGILSTILGGILAFSSIGNFTHFANFILPFIYSCLWLFCGIMGIRHRAALEKAVFLMIAVALPTLPTVVVLLLGIVNFYITPTNMLIAFFVYFPIPICYLVGAYKNHVEHRERKAKISQK